MITGSGVSGWEDAYNLLVWYGVCLGVAWIAATLAISRRQRACGGRMQLAGAFWAAEDAAIQAGAAGVLIGLVLEPFTGGTIGLVASLVSALAIALFLAKRGPKVASPQFLWVFSPRILPWLIVSGVAAGIAIEVGLWFVAPPLVVAGVWGAMRSRFRMLEREMKDES